MEIDPSAVPELRLSLGTIERREGARVVDADGREYVDLESGVEASAPREFEGASTRWRRALEVAALEESLDVDLVGPASAPAVVLLQSLDKVVLHSSGLQASTLQRLGEGGEE